MKYAFILSAIFVQTLFGCSEKSINERFQKTWRFPNNSENILIGRAIVVNNIRGCGEYYIKSSPDEALVYLVACSRDGSSWEYYLVNGGSESLQKLPQENVEQLSHPSEIRNQVP